MMAQASQFAHCVASQLAVRSTFDRAKPTAFFSPARLVARRFTTLESTERFVELTGFQLTNHD